jgi:hypothetical protein
VHCALLCHDLSEVEKSPTFKKFPSHGGVPPKAAGWLRKRCLSFSKHFYAEKSEQFLQ